MQMVIAGNLVASLVTFVLRSIVTAICRPAARFHHELLRTGGLDIKVRIIVFQNPAHHRFRSPHTSNGPRYFDV